MYCQKQSIGNIQRVVKPARMHANEKGGWFVSLKAGDLPGSQYGLDPAPSFSVRPFTPGKIRENGNFVSRVSVI